ncbi:MAG: hypothetical protein ABI556_11205, partial [Gemmatimonadales bacterium]
MISIRRAFLATAVAALSLSGIVEAQTGAPVTTVLKAARMITIASPSVVSDAAIVVTGNRIISAGKASSIAIPP